MCRHEFAWYWIIRQRGLDWDQLYARCGHHQTKGDCKVCVIDRGAWVKWRRPRALSRFRFVVMESGRDKKPQVVQCSDSGSWKCSHRLHKESGSICKHCVAVGHLPNSAGGNLCATLATESRPEPPTSGEARLHTAQAYRTRPALLYAQKWALSPLALKSREALSACRSRLGQLKTGQALTLKPELSVRHVL